jgi:tetratricopeptide (TPR) repeat protein
MFRLLVALVVCGMAFSETVQDWIAKGTRAYAEMKLDESAANFKKAVELDPDSGQARLCYGVISIFVYQNAIAKASTPSIRDDQHSPSQQEFDADARRTRTIIAEVNRTLGKQAEENLRRALEIDPHNLVAKEYLAGLYFWWRDAEEGSSGGTYPSRLDDAHRVYGEIVASHPRNKSANYMLGVIDTDKAFRLVQTSGLYPRPLEDAQARAALAAKLSPLAAEAATVLSVAIKIDANDWFPMSYLMQIRLLQAYAAATEEEAKEAKSEADAWLRKIQSFPGMEPRGLGQNSSSSDDNVLVFERRPGPIPIPPFPPDPKQMLVPGMPPPPAWPPPGGLPKQ